MNADNIMKKYIAIIISALMVFCMLPFETYAVDDIEKTGDGVKVDVADSPEKCAELSQTDTEDPFLDIDTDELSEYEDNDLFIINEDVDSVSDNTVEVVSKFSSHRLMLFSNSEIKDTFGAEKVVFYNDRYILIYDSEHSASSAYEELSKIYGNDVIIDLPLRAQDMQDDRTQSLQSSRIRGWGSGYMNMQGRIDTQNDTASGSVVVAVLDSGVYYKHDIFKRQSDSDTKISDESLNLVDNTVVPNDTHGHGTAVAGIISESTADNVEIMVVKVLDESGTGYLSDLFAGIEYAADNGASIINMSLGADYADASDADLDDLKIADQILEEIYNQNILMVVASGNSNASIDGDAFYPAISEYTVAVGAVDKDGKRASFSNYGGSLDYAAPGYDILIASKNGSNTYREGGSGTSFAAPYISAAAALIRTEHPEYSNSKMMAVLTGISIDLGASGKDVYYGNGCPDFSKLDNYLSKYPDNIDNTVSNKTVKLNTTSLSSATYGRAYRLNLSATANGYSPIKYKVTGLPSGLSASNGVITGTPKATGTFNVTVRVSSGIHYQSKKLRLTVGKANIAGSNINLSGSSVQYTGSNRQPAVSVSGFANDKDYRVTYKNNKAIGKASVTITGIGNCYGSVTKYFNIVPKKVAIKAPARAKKAITVKYGTVTGGVRYQIAVRKKGISKWSYYYATGASKKISKLSRKTNYQVRVRAYKKVGSTTYYGAWSAMKTVKTK